MGNVTCWKLLEVSVQKMTWFRTFVHENAHQIPTMMQHDLNFRGRRVIYKGMLQEHFLTKENRMSLFALP